jgi:integrase
VRSRYLMFTRTCPPGENRVALTSEEYEAILALAPNLVTYDIILTMGQCGLRIGEVFALNVEDVDLDAQVMTVRATMNKCRRQLWAKGARRRKPRIVALNSAFCSVLRYYVEGKPPKAPLFPGPRAGNHQSPDNWRDRVWNEMRDEAAEKKLVRPHVELVPHVLRHSMATWYAAHVPVRLVGDRLGHTTEKVTNGYISRDLVLEREVMDKVYFATGREKLLH